MRRFPVMLLGVLCFVHGGGCTEKKEEVGSRRASESESAEPGTDPVGEEKEGSDTRAALDADLARLMAGFGEAVKGVRDEATWAEARPRVEAILDEIQSVGDRLKALPPPTTEEVRLYYPKTNAREAALEKSLGSKEEFLGKLPEDVAREVGAAAGRFFTRMGEAQIALRGSDPSR
jgi:hypothetical protein